MPPEVQWVDIISATGISLAPVAEQWQYAYGGITYTSEIVSTSNEREEQTSMDIYEVGESALNEYLRHFNATKSWQKRYRTNKLREQFRSFVDNFDRRYLIFEVLERSWIDVVCDKYGNIMREPAWRDELAAGEFILQVSYDRRQLPLEILEEEVTALLPSAYELSRGETFNTPFIEIRSRSESQRYSLILNQIPGMTSFRIDREATYTVDADGKMLVSWHSAVRLYRFAELLRANFASSYRLLMGQTTTNQTEVKTHNTRKNLETFLGKRMDVLQGTSHDNIATLSLAGHGTLSSRTWGIEVEAGGARGVDAPKGWGRKYDGSLRSAYDEPTYIDPEDCEYAEDHHEFITVSRLDNGEEMDIENPDYSDPYYCESCGERDPNDDDEDAAEFVSPILHSFHSRGLEKLLERLREEPQNDSAGVHVHVGAGDLTPKQLGGLVFAYQLIEPLIERSYFRTTREYCKTRPLGELATVLRSSKKAKYASYDAAPADQRTYNNANVLYSGDRYVSLNLCSLTSHGTVEFRAMGPVYEYGHLIRWAYFCREMVNLAKKNVSTKEWGAVRNFADVRALFAKYGEETAAATFAEITEGVTLSYELELQEV